jgi:hypothetical protein
MSNEKRLNTLLLLSYNFSSEKRRSGTENVMPYSNKQAKIHLTHA